MSEEPEKKAPADPGAFGFLSPQQKTAVKLAYSRVTRDLARSRRAYWDWSFSFVLGIHRDLFATVDESQAGVLRRTEVTLRDYSVPSPAQIQYRLADLIRFAQDTINESLNFKTQDERLEYVFTRAAIFHASCVVTQPFIDGNKRWARQILSALLVDCGFPPGAAIESTQKEAYMSAIGQTAAGQPAELTSIILAGWLKLQEEFD